MSDNDNLLLGEVLVVDQRHDLAPVDEDGDGGGFLYHDPSRHQVSGHSTQAGGEELLDWGSGILGETLGRELGENHCNKSNEMFVRSENTSAKHTVLPFHGGRIQ